MTQKINELVSVESFFDSNKLIFLPRLIIWKGRDYKVIKLGLHHDFKKGNTLFHIFSILTPSLFMRLSFNTKSLNWRLMEISNGF